MKKLIVLSAIAALTSGAALADNLNIGGGVASICSVSSSQASVLFPTIINGSSEQVLLTIECNDPDGALMSLTTSEGHLQNADQEDKGVGYSAVLASSVFNLTLNANNGANDTTVSDLQSGFAGQIAGTLDITVTETPVWAGTYADTLMLTITAQ